MAMDKGSAAKYAKLRSYDNSAVATIEEIRLPQPEGRRQVWRIVFWVQAANLLILALLFALWTASTGETVSGMHSPNLIVNLVMHQLIAIP